MSFIPLFFISLTVIIAFIVAMSIGVLFGRRPISGSCGGLNNEGGCALCAGTCANKAKLPNDPPWSDDAKIL